MDSKISRWCEGFIEAGWLAAVVAAPLFFNIHSSRVFEPDKLTLLRSIAVMMAVAWLVRFVDQQGWQDLNWLRWRGDRSIWRMPFVLPVFLLVVVYLLSTAFSVTRTVSLAGSYQRLQGTYTTLSYIVIFALMAATMRSREQVARLVTVIIITSIPVSLYAMLQHFGLDPLPWGGNVQRRVAGHMGNSIFVAAYLIMAVPLTLGRIIDAFTNILNDEELSYSDVVRSSIYIFTLAIQFIAIFWTRSRGPFLGLAAGIYAFVLIMLVALRNAQVDGRRFQLADAGRAFLLVLLGTLLPLFLAATVMGARVSALTSFAFFVGAAALLVVAIFVMAVARRGWRWLWLSWILLAVILAGLLGLFNVPTEAATAYLETPIVGDVLSTMGRWRELSEIGRFGQLLEADEGSGRVRVLIWEGTLDLLSPHEPLEYPTMEKDPFNFLRLIVGYGPESMYVAYNRFYPPELATIEKRNASPDRSHNETFDALVITGVAGLLVWQALYLSVFYYGFRWLGVVRSTLDRNILIGLWIGGAAFSGIAITSLLDMTYLGVALPFGTIVGLVIYLIYYALFARSAGSGTEDLEDRDPFATDRLLMVALVAGILAHYVEIHFGIAIAATRTHFFVFVGLMFVVGYLLPQMKRVEEAAVVEEEARPRRRKRGRISSSPLRQPGWTAPVLCMAIVLALMVGILGYNFMTFSLPGGQQIQSLADVPSVGAIFRYSFLTREFRDSPFIFLMMLLSWVLGVLLALSEIAKQGKLYRSAASSKLVSGRLSIAGAIFTAMLVITLLLRFLSPAPDEASLNRLVGNALLLVWAALCLYAALLAFVGHRTARLAAGVVALVGLVSAIPAFTAGAALHGLVIALGCAAVLYLVWDNAWNDLLLPAAVLMLVSLGVGLFYAYFHGFQIRSGILPPPGVTQSTPVLQRRVMEANQTPGLLTTFYLFVFAILFLGGLFLAQPYIGGRLRGWGKAPAFAALLVLLPLSFYMIGATNLRVIQADIVYKRADPFDKEAARRRDPNTWDIAIAIYERAIELAPGEDFYYLWLGRAYLERSTVTPDQAEQKALLDTAEDELIQAQTINPLNTDHTANLARLNTRWAELSQGSQRQEKVTTAARYYEAAMKLSPNNAVIINEYARLAFFLENNCDKSLSLYEQSVTVDPFFVNSYFDKAEVYLACGNQQPEDEREPYFESAIASLEAGLERAPEDPGRWLQAAEFYIRQLQDVEQGLAAYEEARVHNNTAWPVWRIDFAVAELLARAGETALAERYAQQALTQAPPENTPQIQDFLNQIAGASSSSQ
ncbi:MAG: tetratricopeptide repeat protein [Chloroflexi bacterium]|nr:tetratricopeptide repeat protein [Chloroflexota bacterium]MCI0725284.1 tetratricopeptide repeat protein [Chloroflexota bacterium]